MWPDEKLPSLNQYPFQNTLPLAGGGGREEMVGKHYSCSFSLPPPPRKRGIPDREMGFISETAISYQVNGLRR